MQNIRDIYEANITFFFCRFEIDTLLTEETEIGKYY